MNKKILTTISKLFVPVLVLAMPVAANAHDEESCTNSVAIGHVQYVGKLLGDADFGDVNTKKRGKFQSDQENLTSKALSAEAYILDSKYSNASSKLDDIVDKITSLLKNEKQKIDSVHGEAIVKATLDTMYCLVDMDESEQS